MPSLDLWEDDFSRAIAGYRKDATSRLISYDGSRLYTYMKNHQQEFPKVFAYVEADQYGQFRMKDLLGKYLRFRGLNHKIEKVTPKETERGGGVLYAKPSAAVFHE